MTSYEVWVTMKTPIESGLNQDTILGTIFCSMERACPLSTLMVSWDYLSGTTLRSAKFSVYTLGVKSSKLTGSIDITLTLSKDKLGRYSQSSEKCLLHLNRWQPWTHLTRALPWCFLWRRLSALHVCRSPRLGIFAWADPHLHWCTYITAAASSWLNLCRS